MSIFELIKANLCLKEVARFYGIHVNRSGFTSCLFHNERTPSLKLYEDHFYCYGCCKGGDIIALIAQRLGVSQLESAKIIANDFGLSENKVNITVKPVIKETYAEWERRTIRMLQQYLDYLNQLKMTFKPKNMTENMNDLFIESINTIPQVEYHLDVLLNEKDTLKYQDKKVIKEFSTQIEKFVAKFNESLNI